MSDVKANFVDQGALDALHDVLRSIIDDATGEIGNDGKRIWPIRAANYRLAVKLLEGGLKNETMSVLP